MKTRSGKRYRNNNGNSNRAKRSTVNNFLNSLPQSFLVPMTRQLSNRSLGALLLSDPRSRLYRNTLATERERRNFKNRLRYMPTVNSNFLRMANRLYQIDPNNNSSQIHKRRANAIRNLITRLVLQNNGYYHNGNNRYNYNNGNLTRVPRRPGGVFVTVARDLVVGNNGRLRFR